MYVGARGFSGIHYIFKDGYSDHRFIGFALIVGLNSRRPYMVYDE
jgi:hypothetical protein